MNAQQALQLTIDSRHGISHVLKSIETMAKAGHQFTIFTKDSLGNIESLKIELEALGYKVIITEKNFEVQW